MEEFDVVVVGAGAGGLTVATEAKERGAGVAILSDDRPGGDCSYYGCVPTKTLVSSAKVLDYIRRATEYGLPEIDVQINFRDVMESMNKVVDDVTESGSWTPWKERGFAIFQGKATFLSPDEIEINGHQIKANQIVLAVGSGPAIPPVAGLQNAGYITNVEAVALNELPQHLGILGAGPIGVEFGQLFQRLGAEVTVIEMDDNILPKEDAEVAGLLQSYLEEDGVTIHTGASVTSVEVRDASKLIVTEDGLKIEVDEILVATGREPATSGIGLGRANIELDDKGWVRVDDNLRTSSPRIWAAGDCVGRFLFTHVAEYHAEIVAHNLFAAEGELRRVDYGVVPWATYTDPPLARVGITAKEADEQGLDHRVTRLEISDVERARLMRETRGLIKVVAGSDGRILGASVLAPNGDDLIHEFALAMKADLPVTEISSMIHAYPTLSEAVKAVASNFS